MPVTFVTSEELKMPAEDFAPGIVQKESITHPISEHLSIGYYKVEPGTAEMTIEMPFEEVNYVTEGTASITDEAGNTRTMKKGDVIFMSKGSKVTISYDDKVGLEGFYVISPYNWRELMAGAKQ
jgi:ethanolamine utilization protein EutQ (cupin superfamily)